MPILGFCHSPSLSRIFDSYEGSKVDRFVIDSNHCCELSRSGHLDAPNSSFTGALYSLVSLLLCSADPLAVLRRIARVVIYPINRKARWFLTHVSVKGSEVVAPSVTNCNAAPAIISKLLNLRVGASLDHRSPRYVFRSPTHAMFGCGLIVQAATTLCASGSERASASYMLASASALAQPVACSAARTNIADNRKPIKSLPFNVDKPCSGRNWYNLSSHIVAYINDVIRGAGCNQHPDIITNHKGWR